MAVLGDWPMTFGGTQLKLVGEGLVDADALADDDACRGLLAAIDARTRFALVKGNVETLRDGATVVQPPLARMTVRRSGAEQSNSSVIFDRTAILKVYRRLELGAHPELELGRFLRHAGFTDVPAVLGSMEYRTDDGSCALAVLHALVPDAVDGWEHALRVASKRHDVIPIEILDPREQELPDVGITLVEDLESGALLEIDTSDPKLREAYKLRVARERARREQTFKKLKLDAVTIRTDRPYAEPIANLFRLRQKRMRGFG